MEGTIAHCCSPTHSPHFLCYFSLHPCVLPGRCCAGDDLLVSDAILFSSTGRRWIQLLRICHLCVRQTQSAVEFAFECQFDRFLSSGGAVLQCRDEG